MQKFGLIGKTLQHSFSKSYFDTKFMKFGITNAQYDLLEIAEIKDIKNIFSIANLVGLNVTLPYKESVLSFLDEIDVEAKYIGAVNCIKISEGIAKGYNTDAYGFAQSIKPFLDVNHERALILGTGGASKAVAYALKKIGVEVFFVTSSPEKKAANVFLYSELNAAIFNAFKLIVNTTPLGTFPKIEECPALPFDLINESHFVYDLIYNPAETLLLKNARTNGAQTMNGLSMLQLQAEKSWEIWQKAEF